MFNRILIAFGIRKKVVPDTPARRSTDKVDFNESEITEAYASGKLPKRTSRFASTPPKAPPQRFASQPESRWQLEYPTIFDPATREIFQPTGITPSMYPFPDEVFQAKGGEFSGAGASGSWDSPSTSSSDTSSSSSYSGSSSCGSD